MASALEVAAATAIPITKDGFNKRAKLPYGLTIDNVRDAMEAFLSFLGYINKALVGSDYPRLESLLMPANFSSVVGEFMGTSIPKFCKSLAKNRYHNGHPDLIPAGRFPGDAIQHHRDGIELKASRYTSAWQGHNAEDCWLMVFVFKSNRPVDESKGIKPMSFQFAQVVGAQLLKADWKFAGRSSTSRRTITASVLPSGYEKMMANWIYKSD